MHLYYIRANLSIFFYHLALGTNSWATTTLQSILHKCYIMLHNLLHNLSPHCVTVYQPAMIHDLLHCRNA